MREQDKPEMIDKGKLLSTSEVLRVLNIAKHKLDYLFESRKLKKEVKRDGRLFRELTKKR